jgi:hypothetical protein
MGFTNFALAVLNPLLDGSVLIPGVVSCKNLDSWNTTLVEDFVLLVEESNGISGGLVFVNTCFYLVEEGGFLLNIMMFFDHVCMSCWETLDVLQILLMSLFVDPWVLYLNVLWLKCIIFLLCQEGWLTIVLNNLVMVLLTDGSVVHGTINDVC